MRPRQSFVGGVFLWLVAAVMAIVLGFGAVVAYFIATW